MRRIIIQRFPPELNQSDGSFATVDPPEGAESEERLKPLITPE